MNTTERGVPCSDCSQQSFSESHLAIARHLERERELLTENKALSAQYKPESLVPIGNCFQETP